MSSSAVVAGLTSWFYAAARESVFHRVPYREARRLLAYGTAEARVNVPASWRDRNGGLTLVGIGLVLQMGRAVYVDRCAVSFHALPGMKRFEVVPETVVDFEGLAARLLVDVGAVGRPIKLLAAFLQAGQNAVLLEDMFELLQANRADLEPFWLHFIAQGRQRYSLFDLRSGELHPPGIRLRLDISAITSDTRSEGALRARAGKVHRSPSGEAG